MRLLMCQNNKNNMSRYPFCSFGFGSKNRKYKQSGFSFFLFHIEKRVNERYTDCLKHSFYFPRIFYEQQKRVVLYNDLQMAALYRCNVQHASESERFVWYCSIVRSDLIYPLSAKIYSFLQKYPVKRHTTQEIRVKLRYIFLFNSNLTSFI